MKVMLTDSFRKKLIIALSIIKCALMVIGIPGILLMASGLDAPEPYGTNALIGLIVCMGIVLLAMFSEMFVVGFLVKDNEHINTIWDFNFYGLKSMYNYKYYCNELEKARQKHRRQ